MEIKDLKDIVINCKTEEEAQECCNLADKLGLKWKGGEPYTGSTLWKTYRADMCYDFLAGDCCSCSYAATHNFAIHSSKWFLENYTINKGIKVEEFYLEKLPREKNIKREVGEELECKTLEITIPEGYEIDKDQSSFEKIIFKKIKDIKVFNDLIGLQVPLSSIYIDDSGELVHVDDDLKFDSTCENIFKDELLAKSSLAMSMISQLMPYYGGAITKKEWADSDKVKYTIEREMDSFKVFTRNYTYFFLAFHTKKQRDEFISNNEVLIKQYYML